MKHTAFFPHCRACHSPPTLTPTTLTLTTHSHIHVAIVIYWWCDRVLDLDEFSFCTRFSSRRTRILRMGGIPRKGRRTNTKSPSNQAKAFAFQNAFWAELGCGAPATHSIRRSLNEIARCQFRAFAETSHFGFNEFLLI